MFKVYYKELLELTRDKKTLIFTILLPTLIMPVIMFGFVQLAVIIDQKAENEVLKYHVKGNENFPAFADAIAAGENLERVDNLAAESYAEAIDNEEVRFVIEIPANTLSRMAQGLSAEIEVHYNDSSSTSAKVIKRLEETIESLRLSETEKRTASFGLSQEQRDGLLDPIKLVETSTADERESFGQQLGGLLPYLLILIGLAGAMYPAIDLGVGEKERGTLETLLLTPVPRFQIVFAKFLVIFTTSFLSILFSLLSFAVVATLFGASVFPSMAEEGGEKLAKLLEALSSISFLDIFLMFLMLVPVAAIFGSVLLSVSIYARTFKEAQNYMSPITMLVIIPVVLSILPGVELDWVWASVPLTNVALAIKEIFKGTIDYSMLLVIFASTTIVAGALLALCNWWFQREQVLFRN